MLHDLQIIYMIQAYKNIYYNYIHIYFEIVNYFYKKNNLERRQPTSDIQICFDDKQTSIP